MHYKLTTIRSQLRRKKLTRKNALALCMEHWNAQAEALSGPRTLTPYINRGETWSALTDQKYMTGASTTCAACVYDTMHKGYYCGSNCIIQWNARSCNGSKEYTMFQRSSTKTNALAIAYLAEAALDALEN